MIRVVKFLSILLILITTGCQLQDKSVSGLPDTFEMKKAHISSEYEKISFLSYNLFHIHSSKYNPIIQFPVSNASRNERVPFQALEMKKLAPTFIIVQEAFHDTSRKNLVKLMEPEYAVVNNDSYNIKSGWVQFGSGLLIFYRKDRASLVEGSETFRQFPTNISTLSEKAFSWKGVLLADFVTNEGTVINVVNTHLASLDHDNTIRPAQIKWIKELLEKENIIRKADMQIFGGDFNTNKHDADGSLQLPISALEDPANGGFPMNNIFERFLENEKATWDRANLLVELSKWPLYHNEILDYFFTHSENGKCSDVINARIAIDAKYPLHSLTVLVEERIEKRESAIGIIQSADPNNLEALKSFRVRNGDNGWKWKKGVSEYDPDGTLRKAINDLYYFTDIENRNLTDLEDMHFDFEMIGDVYLSNLSDHYGVYGEVACSK